MRTARSFLNSLQQVRVAMLAVLFKILTRMERLSHVSIMSVVDGNLQVEVLNEKTDDLPEIKIQQKLLYERAEISSLQQVM